jgi:ABC-type sugar transport system ATPase subunit
MCNCTAGALRRAGGAAEPLGVETLLHIRRPASTLVSTVPGISRLQIGHSVRFDIARERVHYFGPWTASGLN